MIRDSISALRISIIFSHLMCVVFHVFLSLRTVSFFFCKQHDRWSWKFVANKKTLFSSHSADFSLRQFSARDHVTSWKSVFVVGKKKEVKKKFFFFIEEFSLWTFEVSRIFDFLSLPRSTSPIFYVRLDCAWIIQLIVKVEKIDIKYCKWRNEQSWKVLWKMKKNQFMMEWNFPQFWIFQYGGQDSVVVRWKLNSNCRKIKLRREILCENICMMSCPRITEN